MTPTETIAAKFRSANGVPVERAVVTADEWKAVADLIEAQAREIEIAIGMLADWCIAVDEVGAGWDDWDECYKDAMYRDGPLRNKLDIAIASRRSRRND